MTFGSVQFYFNTPKLNVKIFDYIRIKTVPSDGDWPQYNLMLLFNISNEDVLVFHTKIGETSTITLKTTNKFKAQYVNRTTDSVNFAFLGFYTINI